MGSLAIFATVGGLVVFFILAELAAAVLPILIVVALVPPEERHGLAELIAATDSSRRLRIWPALRLAVMARRRERVARLDHGEGRTNRHRFSNRSPGSPR